MVRAAGLEPARTKAQDFKSRVATDYTMPAHMVPVVGYAPTTSRVSGERSTNELNGHIVDSMIR